MYWLFALLTAFMVLVILLVRLPKVERTADESAGSLAMYRELLRKRVTWLYFLAIVAYVGCEQGTADWMSQFLCRYHHYNPDMQGATAVAWFWGLLTAGCLIGTFLLKLLNSRTVLGGTCVGALAALSVALFGPAAAAVIAFPVVGLFASVMWPILMSLALNSVAEHHGSVAGLLCSAIMGGAVLPLIIGRIGDTAGLRAGMMLLYVTFLFVMSAAFWAKPLIENATLKNRKPL